MNKNPFPPNGGSPLSSPRLKPGASRGYSVIIHLEQIAPEDLPLELAISAVTMAELGAGPHATSDPIERARRQDRLQRTEATFDPLPVDSTVAELTGNFTPPSWPVGEKPEAAALLIY